jgi:hypothetical protein
MTSRGRGQITALGPLAVLVGALAAAGCYGDCDDCPPYYPPPPSGSAPPSCQSGVSNGSIDADVFLDLDPGMGVGVTAEYASDGVWRFAATCDSLVSNAGCNWTLLVAPIDGTIDDYEAEALEDVDIIQRYPSMAGSTEEDGVHLDSLTDDDDIDAFSVFATPGAGMFVSASIDGNCGGPFFFWTDGGDVKTSKTEATELFPQ